MTNPSKTTRRRSCPGGAFSGRLTLRQDASDYEAGLAPGDYVYNFKVAIMDRSGTGATGPSKFFQVTFTLVDPCDAPNSIRPPGLEDQDYYIGPRKTYQIPAFTVDPHFCEVDYQISVPGGANGANGGAAISLAPDAARTVVIDYNNDTRLIGKEQLVTVVATSKSRYGRQKAPISARDSFKVNFLSRCCQRCATRIQD